MNLLVWGVTYIGPASPEAFATAQLVPDIPRHVAFFRVLKFSGHLPITKAMELLGLIIVFAASCALAVAAGHGVLSLIFRAMTQMQTAAGNTNTAS